MKKLMVAATAMAAIFAVNAEDVILSSENFDGENFQFLDNPYWSQNETDSEVKAYEEGEGEGRYLAIDASDVLENYINEGGSEKAIFGGEGDDAYDGIYVDTMVQFTASEDAPAVSDGDKLVVWLRENEVEEGDPTYTLMVTAGYITDDMGNNVAKNYETSASVIPGEWKRLTITTVTDVQEGDDLGIDGQGTTGFTIAIDGVKVATTEDLGYADIGWSDCAVDDLEAGDGVNTKVFPSLVSDGFLTSIGFKGTGAVDEIAFCSFVNETPEPSAEDWPENPAEVAGQTAADAFPGKVPDALANVPADKLATWAKKAGVDFATGVTVGDVDAYLLDCLPEEVDEKTAEFVIDSISQDENGKWVVTVKKADGSVADGEAYNVNAKVDVIDVTATFDADATVATDAAGFFKATLVPITE